jgi:excinuclease ABC subunit B
MNFQVVSDYHPGDQPQAIEKLTQGIIDGEQFQTY